MAETKEYITVQGEGGSIHISEDVLAAAAAAAAAETDGVGTMAGSMSTDLAEVISGKKKMGKGVHISVSDKGVYCEVSILVRSGFSVQEVAKNVQNAVYTAIENVSGFHVDSVDVNVAGVTFERGAQKEAQ